MVNAVNQQSKNFTAKNIWPKVPHSEFFSDLLRKDMLMTDLLLTNWQ